MVRKNRNRQFALIAAALIIVTLPVLLRPYYEARKHHLAGALALAYSKNAEALLEFRKSVAWRSPFNSAAELSSLELLRLSKALTNHSEARLASEELWRGLQSSRSWYYGIPGLWRGVPQDTAHALLLELNPPPPNRIAETNLPKVNFAWQWLSHLAFAAWVLLAFQTALRNFRADGDLIPGRGRALRMRLAGIALAWFFWLFALSLA